MIMSKWRDLITDHWSQLYKLKSITFFSKCIIFFSVHSTPHVHIFFLLFYIPKLLAIVLAAANGYAAHIGVVKSKMNKKKNYHFLIRHNITINHNLHLNGVSLYTVDSNAQCYIQMKVAIESPHSTPPVNSISMPIGDGNEWIDWPADFRLSKFWCDSFGCHRPMANCVHCDFAIWALISIVSQPFAFAWNFQ